MGTPFTDEEIERIRANTPGCRGDRVHLNHAGSSLPDQRVLDAQIGHLRREAEIGGYEAAAEAEAREAAVSTSLARLIGARPDEIARMEHATAAWNAAFWSVPKRSGQRILTHEQDYGANFVAFARAREAHGVEVTVLPSDEWGQIDLGALAEALSSPDDVALISLAWVPTSGGLVNPAGRVGDLARAAGVPFLLDACQAVGQLDIDVGAIGCDLLSATGRKFLRGPRGTGFLWVSPAILDRLTVSQPDHHGMDWTLDGGLVPRAGARRFEHWEYSHADWLGLGAAADVALELGLDRIQPTVARRADALRRLLRDAGFVVHDQGIAKAGIVTASHPGVDAAALRIGLAAAGINTTTTHPDSARVDHAARSLEPMLRLSVHVTTTDAELDRAVDVLCALV
ncbi:MAG: aminotransferase class V-fold PLP-dependent enzyme [Actinomycetota bacterium]